ncbi:hypothetical protein D9757_008892 [Collybiopsis confluens]|uniref:Uncharacterized protein n=1 Tax=Collybiopsis confluens TaxID=2823264 RepID=A0A8H5M150_9AGAR|nr:hypothetical protein D9757_008892 [Collybiopsis confluens]
MASSLQPTILHDAVASLPAASIPPPPIARGDHQRPADPGTNDLGWTRDLNIPVPVIEGMDDQQLWLLVRRFDRQVFHLRRIPNPPLDRLDCTPATLAESYSPDRLRNILERLYLTIFIGIAASIKHIARIRSWESTRSAWFCAVYFFCWKKDILIPATLTLLLALVLCPSIRPTLFPPAPLAAIDPSTGGVKKPASGHLDSKDSMTGAQERFQGEAVEREADDFVTGLSSIAVSVAVGKEAEPSASQSLSKEEDEEGHVDAKVPDISNVADVVSAQQMASTAAPPSEEIQDQTAIPIQQAIAINTLVDIWEMTGNALTSSLPFKSLPMRVRIASPIAALLLVSFLLPEFWIYKGLTFSVGIALFGQPIFDELGHKNLLKYLDSTFPHWRNYFDIRQTVLSGAPTDKQLTITLLRLGETNGSPLPPPPLMSSGPDSDNSSHLSGAHRDELPSEYAEQICSELSDSDGEDESIPPRKRKGSKLFGFVKGSTKAGVEGVLGLEKAKATVGSKSAKARTGIVQSPAAVEKAQLEDGPSVFRGKWKGTRGVLTISVSATQPLLAFSKLNKGVEFVAPAETVIWTLLIDDIAEIRKIGGFGWKGKMVVGWSTGDKVVDGLGITDLAGNIYHLTALPRRDELFNRLASIGKQRWESC